MQAQRKQKKTLDGRKQRKTFSFKFYSPSLLCRLRVASVEFFKFISIRGERNCEKCEKKGFFNGDFSIVRDKSGMKEKKAERVGDKTIQ